MKNASFEALFTLTRNLKCQVVNKSLCEKMPNSWNLALKNASWQHWSKKSAAPPPAAPPPFLPSCDALCPVSRAIYTHSTAPPMHYVSVRKRTPSVWRHWKLGRERDGKATVHRSNAFCKKQGEGARRKGAKYAKRARKRSPSPPQLGKRRKTRSQIQMFQCLCDATVLLNFVHQVYLLLQLLLPLMRSNGGEGKSKAANGHAQSYAI